MAWKSRQGVAKLLTKATRPLTPSAGIEPEPHGEIAQRDDREDREDDVEDVRAWRPAAGGDGASGTAFIRPVKRPRHNLRHRRLHESAPRAITNGAGNRVTDMAKRDNITDIFVIGGGVNGCGIARDAAGRGYSVFLAEMGDLASGTSSAATKLVHGGLRYLEYYEFRLVHEALAEREVLWAMAPHIIWPLRFVLPHHKGLRPAWFLRLGLFVYDHIGARKLLPPTKTLDLRTDPLGRPLKDGYAQGLRIFRLLGRRCAARGADGPRRRRQGRHHPDPHQGDLGDARGRLWTIRLQDVDTQARAAR